MPQVAAVASSHLSASTAILHIWRDGASTGDVGLEAFLVVVPVRCSSNLATACDY